MPSSEGDKRWIVREGPFGLRPDRVVVSAPERLLHADLIEVRVTLTPLRWDEMNMDHLPGEQIGGQVQFAQIEARDHRAVFHITQQMLYEMFRHYLGVDPKP